MKQSKEVLKSYFETGDYPTEQQFGDLIDSLTNQEEVLGLLDTNMGNEFTYNEIKQLVEENGLVPGKRYIINDYQTKYYIHGTNTSLINREVEVNQIVSGYALFNPPLPLNVGDSVEITAVPEGYSGSLSIGDSVQVSVNYGGGYYLEFSNADVQNTIGVRFKYSVPRFKTATSFNEVTINDSNGKPVLKPGGVINTEVHDGTPYMNMTAEENLAVPIEKIAVIAISTNEFSKVANSVTYLGDELEYDFRDNKVLNDDEKEIASRNGFIVRRLNRRLNINIDKDWRVQRYRRYKISDLDWEKYILNISGDNDLYSLENYNSCTLSNINITENHKYILRVLENESMYLDFTNNGTDSNVFLTGKDNAPPIKFGERFGVSASDFSQIVIVNDATQAKDFTIIPLNKQDLNPRPIVSRIFISKLFNTVFLDNSSQYGNSAKIGVNISDGIRRSTFMTGVSIYSNSNSNSYALSNITAIDNISISNKGGMSNVNIHSSGVINNYGFLSGVTLGGAPSDKGVIGVTYHSIRISESSLLKDTIIGGKRTILYFNNTTLNGCLLVLKHSEYVAFSNSFLYFTCAKTSNQLFTLTFDIDTGTFKNLKKNKFGYFYDEFNSLQGQKIFTNNQGDLLYEVIDGTNNNSKQISILSLSK